MKKNLLVLPFLISYLHLSAQPLREIKSSFENFDRVSDITVISPSTISILGSAFNNGNFRTILTRFSSDGFAANARAFTSAGTNDLSSTTVTVSGDLLLSGNSDLTGTGTLKPTVLRLSPNGSVIWTSSFESEGSAKALDLFETETGQFRGITTNLPGEPSIFFEMDSDGNVMSAKFLLADNDEVIFTGHRYMGNGESVYIGFLQDPNAGTTLPFLAKKIDDTVVWFKTYDNGIALAEDQEFRPLIQSAEDGGIYFATSHSSLGNPTGNEVVLTKVDSQGIVEWSKITESNSLGTHGMSLEKLNSGELWLGFMEGSSEDFDMIISRWSEDGQSNSTSIANNNGRRLSQMVELDQNRLIMAGVNPTTQDSYITEVSPSGDFPCGSETWTGVFSDNVWTVEDKSTEIVPTTVTDVEGEISSIVVSLETEELCSLVLDIEEGEASLIKAYPNPVSDVIFVEFPSGGLHTVILTDLNGKEVLHQTASAQKMELDLTKLAKGIFVLQTEGKRMKLVKE